MDSEFVKLVRIKGVSRSGSVIWKHALQQCSYAPS